jgi:hypothetical protein
MFLKAGEGGGGILKNALFREQFIDVCYWVITWNFISVWLSGYMTSIGKSLKWNVNAVVRKCQECI